MTAMRKLRSGTVHRKGLILVIFWDRQGVILMDFVDRVTKLNADSTRWKFGRSVNVDASYEVSVYTFFMTTHRYIPPIPAKKQWSQPGLYNFHILLIVPILHRVTTRFSLIWNINFELVVLKRKNIYGMLLQNICHLLIRLFSNRECQNLSIVGANAWKQRGWKTEKQLRWKTVTLKNCY